MMTELEFIEKCMSVEWVNRGDTFEGMDCYGLIKLYRSKVVGKPLAEMPGYKDGQSFESLWRKYIDKHWRQLGKFQSGAMVTFYDYSDNPVHVGLCVGDDKVLHARGDEQRGGKVEIHSIHTLSKLYKYVTYHKAI